MKKSPDAFRTISEVAEWLGTPTHVLRFWESRFSQVKPVKRAGGRRYYRPSDMELLGGIKRLLHDDGMTIRGVQKLLREEGVRHVAGLSAPIDISAAIDGEATPVAPQDPELVIEAPMEVDVEQEPVDNVVAIGGKVAPPPIPPQDEAPIDLAEDLFPPEAPAVEEQPEMAPEDQEATPSFFPPLEDTDPEPQDPVLAAIESALDDSPEPQEDPEPALAEPEQATPAPIAVDVPDDPEDDDAVAPAITDVAASLRNAASATPDQRPSPEVFAELYNRLTGLKDRMDSRVSSNATE
ncbi:MAG: MerR family transcriptional regulator [Marinosulfonomonas sp.]